MQDPLSSVDHIESKCEELRRTSALLIDKILKRNTLLHKARELMDRIDKVSRTHIIKVDLNKTVVYLFTPSIITL